MKQTNTIGGRCYEVFKDYYGSTGVARDAEGWGRNTMSQWLHGVTPNGKVIARAYELGLDVQYILTGKHKED